MHNNFVNIVSYEYYSCPHAVPIVHVMLQIPKFYNSVQMWIKSGDAYLLERDKISTGQPDSILTCGYKN